MPRPAIVIERHVTTGEPPALLAERLGRGVVRVTELDNLGNIEREFLLNTANLVRLLAVAHGVPSVEVAE